jgi:hypothetical protein
MIDPELKTHLETIEKELVDLRISSTGFTPTLLRGMVYGTGYVLGAVLVVIIVGWILNIVGIIPAFNDQVDEFRTALQRIGGPVK